MRSRLAIPITAAAILCGSAVWSQEGGRSTWEGVYSAAQQGRGHAAYETTCARCHGAEKEGGEMAPALVGSGFLANWDKQDAGALADRIRTTMPVDAPGTLSQAQTADIVADVLAANGMPAGATDLPREPAAQKSIRIDALKP